jgi:hypothetical protein
MFYNHFWSFFLHLHKNLSQNWSSNGDFEVLNCLNLHWFKSYDTKFKIFHIWFFASYMKLTKTDESMKCYFKQFYEYLLIRLLYRHLLYLMLNVLSCEIWNMNYVRICQKIHTKVTITMSMLSRFFESDVIIKKETRNQKSKLRICATKEKMFYLFVCHS